MRNEGQVQSAAQDKEVKYTADVVSFHSGDSLTTTDYPSIEFCIYGVKR